MAWVILVRTLFVLAVTYAAFVTRPFSTLVVINLIAGAALGVLMLLVESRLRSAEVTDLLGALIGGAIGLGLAQDDRRRAVLGGHHRPAGDVPPQLHPAGLPVSRHRHGGAQRRMAEAGASGRAVPRHRAAAALPDPRHQRDHRRPHRRRLRDRLSRRHAGDSAVRAEGAAAGRRFRRLDEAQPRPPRPRHPAEDPEDGRRRTSRCRTSIFPTSAKWI